MNHVIVQAPTSLNSATRGPFYDAALAALEQLGGNGSPGRLVIDMRRCDRVDSTGLSVLVLLQVRAAERKHSVALLDANEEIRFLLLMTRLEDRFDLDPQL